MMPGGQEDAYRFARGEEVTTTHGLRVKLSRPLDFLVISDHAEMYGLMPQLLRAVSWWVRASRLTVEKAASRVVMGRIWVTIAGKL